MIKRIVIISDKNDAIGIIYLSNMNNDGTSVEQHPSIVNHQAGNWTWKERNSQRIVKVTKKGKNFPMIPTPLYILFSYFQS